MRGMYVWLFGGIIISGKFYIIEWDTIKNIDGNEHPK